MTRPYSIGLRERVVGAVEEAGMPATAVLARSDRSLSPRASNSSLRTEAETRIQIILARDRCDRQGRPLSLICVNALAAASGDFSC